MKDTNRYLIDECDSKVQDYIKELESVSKKYYDLLFCLTDKIEGQTRHEQAKEILSYRNNVAAKELTQNKE